MNSEILNRILDLNPWLQEPTRFERELSIRLPGTFIDRQVDLRGLDDPRRAKLIVGPRQSGKSTFVWSQLAQHAPQSLLFLNAEEALVQRWARSAAGMLADLRAEFPDIKTLFIDEAQHLDNAGLLVKGLIDGSEKLNVFVTGSSTYHLDDRVRESLAGRAERRLLLPLSLGEINAFRPSTIPAVRQRDSAEATRRMRVLGSYPRVWTTAAAGATANAERELHTLLEAFVLRDASDRFRIRRPEAFRRLIQLAAGQIGQLVNYSEWSAHLGVAASTVKDYVGLMEESWILRLLPPFAGGRRREITGAPRIHFYDPGLRNATLGALSTDIDRRPDRGPLAEALTFAELAKALPSGWGLHYWRAKGGAEMDFVLVAGERRIGVEVKAGARLKLSRSVRSFISAYAPEVVFLVGGAEVPVGVEAEQIENTRLLRIPVTQLAKAIGAQCAPDPASLGVKP